MLAYTQHDPGTKESNLLQKTVLFCKYNSLYAKVHRVTTLSWTDVALHTQSQVLDNKKPQNSIQVLHRVIINALATVAQFVPDLWERGRN